MKIRTARESDLDAICRLSVQVNELHHRYVPDVFIMPDESETDKVFWSERLDEEKSVFLVIENDAEVLGFITAKITEHKSIPFLVPKKICRIGTIVVAESYQRQTGSR